MLRARGVNLSPGWMYAYAYPDHCRGLAAAALPDRQRRQASSRHKAFQVFGGIDDGSAPTWAVSRHSEVPDDLRSRTIAFQSQLAARLDHRADRRAQALLYPARGQGDRISRGCGPRRLHLERHQHRLAQGRMAGLAPAAQK